MFLVAEKTLGVARGGGQGKRWVKESKGKKKK